MLLASALLLCACSGGLKLQEGNAFPCDFAAGEATRDAACPSGWVCGLENRCQSEDPEALQLPAAPDPSVGRRLSPLLIDSPVRVVGGEPRLGLLFVAQEDKPPFVVAPGGVFRAAPTPTPAAQLPRAAAVAETKLALTGATGVTAVADLAAQPPGTPALVRYEADGGIVTDGQELRAVTGGLTDGGIAGRLYLRTESTGFGELRLSGFPAAPAAAFAPLPTGFTGVGLTRTPCFNGPTCPGTPLDTPVVPGPLVDARPVLRGLVERPATAGADPVVPVVATRSYLFARAGGADGNAWVLLNPDEPIAPVGAPGLDTVGSQLRHNESATVYALDYRLGGGGAARGTDVLVTWRAERTAGQRFPSLVRAWDDCAPCREQRLVGFTPAVSGATGVEVLCEAARGARTLWRVTGAATSNPLDACLREPVAAPLALDEVSSEALPADAGVRVRPQALDRSQGAVLTVGGQSGQLWAGASLSRLRPLFLDRAPLAAGWLDTGLLTLSERFLAVDVPVAAGAESNGLQAVPLEFVSSALGEQDVTFAGPVRGLDGWLMLSSGDLVVLAQGAAPSNPTERRELRPRYGPRLLAPDATSAAAGPFLGEAVVGSDRALLLLSAGDQVYFTEVDATDVAALSDEPNAVAGLVPRLTPEPGFPLRALALDPSVAPTGTGGLSARGWAVTSRSLFLLERDTQGVAKATQLPLGAGEPVDVWAFAQGGVGYGRVGLRDGTVLRLPGGLPLTQALEAGPVLDYASLGGYPVALTEGGVFVASEAAGRLRAWRPLSPPAGVGGLSGARLEVVRRGQVETLYLFTRQGFAYVVARAQAP